MGKFTWHSAKSTALVALFFLAAALPSAGGAATDYCPPLDAPTGNTVTADSAAEIWTAVNTAVEGDTIYIADGTYNLAAQGYYIWIDTPGVTLRSLSGDRDAVVLDNNYQGTETITILASDVTVADITVKRARTHPIHVVSTGTADTLRTKIYNVRIVDPGQQAIKINPGSDTYFPDYGEVACCEIELTSAGRAQVLAINGSCYTGGVDGHKSMGWTIRDNTIKGFWCSTGLSEHGVHFWTGSRDTVVERNRFVDNARAVGFGLNYSGDARTYDDDPCPDAEGYVGHYGGVIRNNFVFASDAGLFSSDDGADTGFALWQACGVDIVHNSLAFASNPFSAIEYRFDNTYANIVNNLATYAIMDRGGHATLDSNLTYQPLSIFVDGSGGDLHLDETSSAAIDQGADVEGGLCDDDIDGDLRPSGSRDIGADEIDEFVKSVANGLWSSSGTWENNTVPASSSPVLIDSNTEVTIDDERQCHYLVAASLSTLDIVGGGALTVGAAY